MFYSRAFAIIGSCTIVQVRSGLCQLAVKERSCFRKKTAPLNFRNTSLLGKAFLKQHVI